MSLEFIKASKNRQSLYEASKQEKQLRYFTQSSLADDNISESYLQQWAERNYIGSDYFLNYVKSVFKTENFLFFFKYLRKPLPSTKLINNKIKPQLNRVFTAENSDFRYDVLNVDDLQINELLHTKQFEEELFNKLLFAHNSILVTDLDAYEPNKPNRYFVDIDDVVSIDHDGNHITKICFAGCIEYEEKTIGGFVYIDEYVYQFYDSSYNLISSVDHDLGECPADFISKNKYKDDFIVRESLFTYIREELEEYNFLKTLQKMTDPNGALPVVTKLEVSNDDDSINGSKKEPVSDDIMGSQRAGIWNEVNNAQTGDLQAGTIHEVPLDAVTRDDGTIDMEAIKSYLNFFYLPVDALNYLKIRISEVENSIISTLIGTIDTSNEESKNEMQIEKSIIVLENTLIWLADSLNYIRSKSDKKMLKLAFGYDQVKEVFIFYGTDFFLESISKLYDDFLKAPNPIERKNILVRINQNKFKNNQGQIFRHKLLYDLMPFVSDKDFEIAMNIGLDNVTLQYQLRFSHWIGLFESQYGDIVSFYRELDGDQSQKHIVINNLIIELINRNLQPIVN